MIVTLLSCFSCVMIYMISMSRNDVCYLLDTTLLFKQNTVEISKHCSGSTEQELDSIDLEPVAILLLGVLTW